MDKICQKIYNDVVNKIVIEGKRSNMDVDKLQSFLTLAEMKNFTKAADKLYISQPALSKQIKSLEDEWQVPLFDRVGKQTFLTIYGEHFKQYAEDILGTYLNAREHIRQIENLKTGTLHFGATNLIGVYLMPELIAKFRKKYPDIEIDMTINSSKNILELLHRNRLEFIFLSDYILENNQSYISGKYKDDELFLVVGNRHPLFGRKECSLSELREELFITKNENSSQEYFISRELEKFGFQIQHRMRIGHQEAIKEAVIEGIGIAFISGLAVEREVQQGLLQALRVRELSLTRSIVYVFEKNRHLTPAAKAFLYEIV